MGPDVQEPSDAQTWAGCRRKPFCLYSTQTPFWPSHPGLWDLPTPDSSCFVPGPGFLSAAQMFGTVLQLLECVEPVYHARFDGLDRDVLDQSRYSSHVA